VLFTLVGAAEAALLPFLPIVLVDHGLSPVQIGVALGVASLAGFVGTPLWGHAADRRLGAERALVVVSLTAALAAAPLALADGFVGLTLAVVLLTAIRSSMTSLIDAIALEHLGEDRNEYGRVRLWQSLGWAASACVWGLVLQFGSLNWMPAIYAICALVVAVSAYSLRGPRNVYVPSPLGTRRSMIDVSFQDSGVGIPRELMEKIFDPFFTTRSTGTGLGLPISVQIMREVGGVITAKNNPSGGATLRVSFPVPAETPGRAEDTAS